MLILCLSYYITTVLIFKQSCFKTLIAPLILYKYLQNKGETRKKRLNCIFQTCTLHIDTTFILHTYALMYGSHHFLLSNYLLALHDLKAGNKVYGYYYTINLGPLYYSLYVIWCNAMDPTLNVSIKFFVSWLNQGTIEYWSPTFKEILKHTTVFESVFSLCLTI